MITVKSRRIFKDDVEVGYITDRAVCGRDKLWFAMPKGVSCYETKQARASASTQKKLKAKIEQIDW